MTADTFAPRRPLSLRNNRTLLLAALALLLAGVVGHLTNRVLYGHVIDLHVPLAHGWPALSLADACISIAVVLLVIGTFRSERVPPRLCQTTGGRIDDEGSSGNRTAAGIGVEDAHSLETSCEAESVSIIVPTRNEADNLGALVSAISARAVGCREILIVDAESTDGTPAVVDRLAASQSIRLIKQPADKPGLAAAVMAGAHEAEGEFLLVMDADLSHPASRINDLLRPLFTGTADMVIGSRYIAGGSTPGWPLWRRALSRVACLMAYPLTRVHDSMSGFFAIRRSRLLALSPPTVGFKIAFDVILRAQPSLRVREVPIAFRDRVRGQSKFSFQVAVRFFCRWLIAMFCGVSKWPADAQPAGRIFRLTRAGEDNGAARKFLIGALALVILTVATRLPALLHPAAIDDEAVYSVVANEMVDGGKPYLDAVERKPPLLFWTYAAVFNLAGKYNWLALHSVAVVWTLATMAGLYLAARELFDSRTGMIAALLYSVFQPWGTWKNLAFNGELLMNLPLVWAWAIALRRSSSPWRPELLVAGALSCAAFLLKQPAAIAAAPLGAYLLLPGYRAAHGLSFSASLRQAALFSAGFFATLAAVALVLWKQGILADAFYWTISNHSLPYLFWNRAVKNTLFFAGACLLLLLAAAGGFRSGDTWRGKSAERVALVWLLIASAIGTAAGGRFYPHYYIQLIPPLALLAAPFLARLWSGTIAPHRWGLRPVLSKVWIALTIIAFAIAHVVGLVPRRAPPAAGNYIREHSIPTDRIFVWGHRPQIYLAAQRRPASRFILTFPLTGYVFGGPVPGLDTRPWILPWAWSTLESDFAEHSPAYIVDVESRAGALYPVRDFPILASLLARNYEPITETAEGLIYRRRPGAAGAFSPLPFQRDGCAQTARCPEACA